MVQDVRGLVQPFPTKFGPWRINWKPFPKIDGLEGSTRYLYSFPYVFLGAPEKQGLRCLREILVNKYPSLPNSSWGERCLDSWYQLEKGGGTMNFDTPSLVKLTHRRCWAAATRAVSTCNGSRFLWRLSGKVFSRKSGTTNLYNYIYRYLYMLYTYKSHRINVSYISYLYHENQLNVGKYLYMVLWVYTLEN